MTLDFIDFVYIIKHKFFGMFYAVGLNHNLHVSRRHTVCTTCDDTSPNSSIYANNMPLKFYPIIHKKNSSLC